MRKHRFLPYHISWWTREDTGLRRPWESKQYIAGDEKWTRPELWWICYLLPAKDRIEIKQRPTIGLMKMLSCWPSRSFTALPWANDHNQVRRRMNSSIHQEVKLHLHSSTPQRPTPGSTTCPSWSYLESSSGWARILPGPSQFELH